MIKIAENENAFDLGGASILVVEDDVDSCELVVLLLQTMNAAATSALSASEAREILGLATPDVVLCDLGLPGEDGYSLLAWIRKNERIAKTPVIALTGYVDERSRVQTREAGFCGHLGKPFDQAMLHDAIRRALASVREGPPERP